MQYVQQTINTQNIRTGMPSVLWCCWLGSRNSIWPVKTEWWGAGVVICLECSADLHMAQLMPLPLTVSCFSKIQIRYTFLVPADPGSLRQRAVTVVCVCVCVCMFRQYWHRPYLTQYDSDCETGSGTSLKTTQTIVWCCGFDWTEKLRQLTNGHNR